MEENLKSLIKAKNLKQVILCQRLGVPESRFSEFLSGKKELPNNTVHELSRILEIPVEKIHELRKADAGALGEERAPFRASQSPITIRDIELEALRGMVQKLLEASRSVPPEQGARFIQTAHGWMQILDRIASGDEGTHLDSLKRFASAALTRH